MNHLRSSVLGLVFLVTFFFNIERLHLQESGPLIDLQTFVYILGFGIIVLTLVLPFWKRIPIYLPISFWSAIYFVCKLIFFRKSSMPLIGDYHTFISVVELSFLWLCFLLSRQVANDLYDFEQTLENITFPDLGRNLQSLPDAVKDIEAEFLRSRRHQHPVGVIIVEPQKGSIQAALHRTVQEVQRTMMSRYVVVSMGRVISDIVRRTDMVLAQKERDRFIVVCPETDSANSRNLAERIRSVAQERLGVQVEYGVASFPQDALTFKELVRHADTALKPLLHDGRPKPGDESGHGEGVPEVIDGSSSRDREASTTLENA